MTWAAVAIGGSTLVSGYLSKRGAKQQSDAQIAAMNEMLKAGKMSIEEYQKNLAKMTPMFEPYIKSGTQAFGELNRLMQPGGELYKAPDMTNFRSDPQWLNIKNQIMKQLAQQFGGRFSGQTALDLEQQANNQADQQYQQIYARKTGEQNTLAGRLGSLSEAGYRAIGDLGNLGFNTAQGIAGAYGGMGVNAAQGLTGEAQAKAMGNMGLVNTLQSGLGLGLNQWNANQMRTDWNNWMNQPNPYTSSYVPNTNMPMGTGYVK